MTIYEKESVENKLFRLEKMTEALDEIKVYSKKEFLNDRKLSDSGMFNLMIGITIILDIGQHLLTRYKQRTAKEYKEVINLLGKEKIVPLEFAEVKIEMAKFRNLMVHDYDKIDEAMAYDYIQKVPDIFRQFAKYFVEFIDKNKISKLINKHEQQNE